MQHFIAVLLDTLLELFYRRRGSTFNIFISKPHTVSIIFISAEYGGHCMWWKGWFVIHATLVYQYEGLGWCIVTLEHKNKLRLTKHTLSWRVKCWLTIFTQSSWFTVPGISSRWQKWLFFSAICTGIYGKQYNCVLQWMLVHRDPKRVANISPLTKGQSWTDFCVQLTLGTYPGSVWNKEATQNVFGPCRSPFHGNEEWHLLQQLWCNTNRQLSYNEKKTASRSATIWTLFEVTN